MGQTDKLISGNYLEAKFGTDTGEALTLPLFAGLLRDQAAALANVKKESNEGADMPVTPGAFIATCSDHETIGDSTQVFGVKIRVGNTQQALTVFEVFQNWLEGKQPSILIAPNPQANTCPGNRSRLSST